LEDRSFCRKPQERAPGETGFAPMKKIKKYGFFYALSIVSLFLFIPGVYGENPPIDPAKKTDIHRLIKMSGMSAQVDIMSQYILSQYLSLTREKYPGLSPDLVSIMKEKCMEEIRLNLWAPGGFFDRFVPMYDKYFTHQEILALIEFHESPVGKKILSLQPVLVKEGMSIGEQWSKDILMDIIKNVERRLIEEDYMDEKGYFIERAD
jgi:hypothetical protein